MPKYTVEWTLLGATTVEAADEKEARRLVEWDLPDEKIYADITDMEITTLSRDDGGDD